MQITSRKDRICSYGILQIETACPEAGALQKTIAEIGVATGMSNETFICDSECVQIMENTNETLTFVIPETTFVKAQMRGSLTGA